MEEGKNLEELFRSSFEHYRVAPPEAVWHKVQQQTATKPGTWWGMGVAGTALVAALFLAWWWGSGRASQTLTHVRVWETNAVSGDSLPAGVTSAVSEPMSADSSARSHQLALKAVPSKPTMRAAKLFDTTKQITGRQPAASESLAWDDRAFEQTQPRLSIDPQLRSPFGLAPSAGCEPHTISLPNLADKAEELQWIFGDGSTARGPVSQHTYQQSGRYLLRLRLRTADNRWMEHSETIEVFPKPDVRAELSANQMIESGTVYFNNYSHGQAFEWLANDSLFSIEREPMRPTAELAGRVIKLKVRTENNCIDSAVIRNPVQREEVFFINLPNAFVADPSGASGGTYNEARGSSTVFHPRYKGVQTYRLEVFNRLGQLVFVSTDPRVGWDGYTNNQLAQPGVYVWKLTGSYSNGQPFVKQGDVTLLRK